MHIGIDASRAFISQPTGTENYSLNLILALAKIDRENEYTLYVKSNFQFSPPAGGFNLQFPENFKFKVISWPYLWTQGGLTIECLGNPPDVLFIPAHTLPIARRPSLKTVVTIHDLGAEFLPQHYQFPSKLYLNRATEYAAKHATRLIAVSKSTRNDLVRRLHCDTQKIIVIYEGYDKENFQFPISNFQFKTLRKRYRISGEYILFVGTVQPRKNLVRLIEAFSLLKNISDLSLVIVGKPGWMFEEIYAAPKKFRVEKRVKFLDYVSDKDLPFFYQNALCFALPSLYEGFGLPTLEAMACGCPVVASRVSSLPELVGEAGVLVDPYDTGNIAMNLQLIINNLQLREDLIKKGLKQVKKFSWEKCARQTLGVLEKI